MKKSNGEIFVSSEKKFLDEKSLTYVAGQSTQDNLIRKLAVQTFRPFIEAKIGLELGCSDGYMTQLLSSQLKQLDVVEGSKNFINKAKKRNLKNVSFKHCLFEEFKPVKQYDYIFLCYVLEHVNDVEKIFKIVHRALYSDGLLFIVVPNSRALSRQLAYHMGLIPDLKELTQNDFDHGHRRVYDRVSLNRDIENCGFTVIAQGGIMLKLLADFQMDRLIDMGVLQKPQISGLYRLGFEYPDLCGSIYSICKIAGH
jgi:2-polyprenyl-3-methyl-5-hydroxy-6-metoxy-1,4-benzoquinol methylase